MEKELARKILEKSGLSPRVGIILGSGFASAEEHIEPCFTLNVKDIKGYPPVSVGGHNGKIIAGKFGGIDTVVFSGRTHFYEGYSAEQIVLPVRIMKELGCAAVILTNAAGAVNEGFCAGEFAVITDHISNSMSNPLMGKNYRFVDMCNAYDKQLRKDFVRFAAESGIVVREGVYIYFSGPSFETPAEIRAARIMGADLVGMSTVAETIAARSLGMRVLALSFISNMAACDGIALDHNSFVAAGREEFDKIASALKKVCINI